MSVCSIPGRIRRASVVLLLSCGLVLGVGACGDSGGRSEGSGTSAELAADPSASVSASATAKREKYNRAKFAANVGLAAGATYQWIIKPYRAGKFKKGADGRTFTLVKAGAAGAFAYNRLKAAQKNAKGDPVLTKALAPITAGVESLRNMGTRLRNGSVDDSGINGVEDLINNFRDAGKEAGVDVQPRVPSTSQLNGG
ncbi:hypothetical protein AB0M28_26940 [Streptomyces sp. NPDC051940]|uniref:hypothetical protein n=1 Tax=Streptomyces sp. NPDC051940 TaxID=3155675 RepID=UPI00343CFC7F